MNASMVMRLSLANALLQIDPQALRLLLLGLLTLGVTHRRPTQHMYHSFH